MKLLLVIASLSVSLAGIAQENAVGTEVENIAAEYATCAAYYRLVYHGAEATNRKDIADRYRQLEDDAMFLSLLLANEGRDGDMAVKVTNARIESSMKAMKNEIGDRNENFAILINKYGEPCVAISTEPPEAARGVLLKRLQEVPTEGKQ
jgi:hypothetical protein